MLDRRKFGLSVVSGALFGAQAIAQSALSTTYVPNHPLYAPSLDAMAQRNWDDLVSIVSALPPQSAYTLLRDIGDGSPVTNNLRALSRVEGGRTVAGAIQVGWAWRYRGSAVEIQDEDQFARHLFSAADLLSRAIQRDPDDGVAAAFLFRALKAFGDADALRDLLPLYLAASRKPVEGLAAYADAVTAKWVGSEAEALQFARQYANSQPAASYGLIPDAHYTTAVARVMSDDVAIAATADGYLHDPAVISEIIVAHDDFLAAPPDADPFATMLAHSQFSLVFLQTGDVERGRMHLGPQGTFIGGPWTYLPDPASAIRRMRTGLRLDRS